MGHKGHYGQYSGNHPRFSKRQDEAYDAKMAYDKDLTGKARLHYLENDRHDHESPAKNIVGMAGKAVDMAKKAAISSKVKDYNKKNIDAGAPDDFNISKNKFYRNELRKKGIHTFHAVPRGEENQQWDGNEWSSPSPANSNCSPMSMHTDAHIRRQAERIARKREGDVQDIYYELKARATDERSGKKKGNDERSGEQRIKDIDEMIYERPDINRYSSK